MPSHPSHWLGNLALVVVSTLVAFLPLECGYRWQLDRTQTYNATSKPLYEYSPELGYGYIPGARAVGLYVRRGKVFTCDSVSVGPYGNLGDGVRSWGDNDFKVLALGASFTANPYKYSSWADHIAEPLKDMTGKNVEVMNLGRDSFGVMNMMRLANATLKTTRADLVVVAFIADDLDRARTWRTSVHLDGMDRILMSLEPFGKGGATEHMQPTADIVLVNGAITEEWCQSALASGTRDDPTLISLHEQRQKLAPDNFTEGLWSVRSFLLDRLLYGDPYHKVRKLPALPRVEFSDFRQEEAFVRDVKELMSQQVPVLLVLLPGYDDLKAGAVDLTAGRRALLESLQALSGEKIVDALDYLDNPTQDIEAMFFVPEDTHPRELGSRRYAQAIVKAIRARWDPAKGFHVHPPNPSP